MIFWASTLSPLRFGSGIPSTLRRRRERAVSTAAPATPASAAPPVSRGVFAFFAKVATPWAAVWVPDVSVSLTDSAGSLPFDVDRARPVVRVRPALDRLCDALLERARGFEDARRRDALAFV